MKFCEKMAKQRKNNNLSQEMLADRLGVSRQAVSKWESGSSYPDMDKMIQICNILNCTLEDILDDGVIKTSKVEKNSNGYIDSFFSYITKIYNMFYSMTFKDKIKCILEISFLGFILFLILLVVFSIVTDITHTIFNIFPYAISRYINIILDKIITIALLGVGIIIVLHVFKIRYLDYFVTVEDNHAKTKTIEKSIDKNNEKIIIRDPKHSNYSFFSLVAKISIVFFKMMLGLLAIFCIGFLIFILIIFTISVYYIKYGIFFFGTSIAFLGVILITILVSYILYNFIFNEHSNFKRVFLLSFLGFIFVGVGIGVSFLAYADFDQKEIKKDYVLDTNYIEMNDNIVLNFLEDYHTNVIIDDSINNIKIEVIHLKDSKFNLNDYYDYSFNIKYYDLNYDYDYNFVDNFNDLVDKIKDKKRIDYNYDYLKNVNIYISKDNLTKIRNNYR